MNLPCGYHEPSGDAEPCESCGEHNAPKNMIYDEEVMGFFCDAACESDYYAKPDLSSVTSKYGHRIDGSRI